jgi:hypothetical protein
MNEQPLQERYNDFTVEGIAEPTFGQTSEWVALSRVLFQYPNNSVLQVCRFGIQSLTWNDKFVAKWMGLEVAKLLVDKTAMAAAYYLRPMDIGWAVDILRRAAVACVRREIRIAKVYEALDFLEKAVDEKSAWLVRRYRRELRWDRRNNREKEELREILRVTTRGIQFACAGLIVRRLNELAIHFRENKPSIDNLRQQLAIVRRPVPR